MANNDNLNNEDMLEDLDASFYDYTLEMKKSSFDAETIGLSPIEKVLKLILRKRLHMH